jgi:hypothetical protein
MHFSISNPFYVLICFCETFKKSFFFVLALFSLHCVDAFVVVAQRIIRHFYTLCTFSLPFFSERGERKNFWNAFAARRRGERSMIQLCAAIASLYFSNIFLSFISVLHALPLIFSFVSLFLLACLLFSVPFVQLMY